MYTITITNNFEPFTPKHIEKHFKTLQGARNHFNKLHNLDYTITLKNALTGEIIATH